MANYIFNRSSTVAKGNKTPFELLYKNKPNISNIRVFGSKAYQLVNVRKGKLAPKGSSRIYIGPSEETEGAHRLWNPDTCRVTVSRSVKFFEPEFTTFSTITPMELRNNENNSENISNSGKN